jgi:lysophospholipase L1-like esterase
VLSIPDWGVTPFAEGREREKIASEIDAFNEICAKISRKYEIAFIEITEQQRIEGSNEEYLAADKLHPSGREYAKWAQKLFKAIKFSIVNAN